MGARRRSCRRSKIVAASFPWTGAGPGGIMYSLSAYDSVTEARTSIMHYLDWYNRFRPHSSLGKQTPDEAYAVMLPTVKLAA